MRTLPFFFMVFFSLGVQLLFGQNEAATVTPNSLNGLWEIDLRPAPDAEPYLKDFIVQFTDDSHFSGSFYDTAFDNGKVNVAWDGIHFAFSTKDRSSTYVTVGHFDGQALRGTTYCEERDFVMPWRGERK